LERDGLVETRRGKSRMALYKHGKFFTQTDDAAFDTMHTPWNARAASGDLSVREL
jgi:hypothetical protein